MSDTQYKLGDVNLLAEAFNSVDSPSDNLLLSSIRKTINSIVWRWVRVNYDRPIYSGKVLGIFSFTVYVRNVTNLIAIIVGPEER